MLYHYGLHIRIVFMMNFSHRYHLKLLDCIHHTTASPPLPQFFNQFLFFKLSVFNHFFCQALNRFCRGLGPRGPNTSNASYLVDSPEAFLYQQNLSK